MITKSETAIYNEEYLKTLEVERELVLESITAPEIKNGIRTIITFIAEAGLLGLSGGSAAPLIASAETVINIISEVASVASVVSSLSQIPNLFRDISGGLSGQITPENFLRLMTNGLDGLYEGLRLVWSGVLRAIPNAQAVVTRVVNRVQQLFSNIGESVANFITMVIPEAIARGAIVQTIISALTSAGQNSFTLLKNAILRIPFLRHFATPAAAFQTIEQGINSFYGFIDRVENFVARIPNIQELISSVLNEEKEQLLEFDLPSLDLPSIGEITNEMRRMVELIRQIGLNPFRAIINYLKSHRNGLSTAIRSVCFIVVPAVFGLAASVQIILSDSWRSVTGSHTQVTSPQNIAQRIGAANVAVSAAGEVQQLSSELPQNVLGNATQTARPLREAFVDTERWKKLAKING